MDEARVATQGERVRSELFSSLSSDLKEPLSSISSAVSSLKADRAKLGDSGREDLLTTIEDESERLSRFVTNLTNMTNIEAGGVRLNMQPVDLEEVIGLALERNGRLLSHHAVKVDIDADLPILELDKLLLEQVIVHLLENAAKYAARGSEIVVSAKARDDAIILQVIDEGPGIPLAKLSGLFDKQEKPAAGEAPDATGRRPGLGLAICQGFVAALGGTIQAANRTDRSGAIFTVTFPSRHRIAA
jgi:two-component system sensor histidine kinase KdpD